MKKLMGTMTKDKIILLFGIGILLFILSFPIDSLQKSVESDRSLPLETGYEGTDSDYRQMLESELETLIGTVKGAGKVKVMILLKDGGQKIAEKDVQQESRSQEPVSGDGIKEESLIREEQSVRTENESPWIRQELLPEAAGIAVVAQGGGDSGVKARITALLQALFGLPSHKITVLEGQF